MSYKLAHKLPIYFAGIALVVGVAVASVGLTLGTSALVRANRAKLETVTSSRTQGLKTYFEDIKTDLGLVARNPLTLEALSAFSVGYSDLGADAMQKLQTAYITDNPNATGEKH